MSEKVKGVKIRFENGILSQEIPIGALAQNVDYNEQNVKQTLDKIDLSDRIKKGTGTSGIILNNISFDSNDVNSGNLASGAYSVAEGYGTKATQEQAHAEGQYSTASGKMSHAEGHQTIASGSQSHAEGYYTVATGSNQHVSGIYNIADANNKYAEIIGNGTTNASRSNARTLDWNGNEWIKGSLKIGGASYDDTNAKSVITSDNIKQQVQDAIADLGPITITVDKTLTQEDMAAESKTVGQRLSNKVDKPIVTGTTGQFLQLKSDGTTQWGWASVAGGISDDSGGEGGSGVAVELDDTLTFATKAAQAKATGDKINTKLDKPTVEGISGQILQKTATGTQWINNSTIELDTNFNSTTKAAQSKAVGDALAEKADANDVYTKTVADSTFVKKPTTNPNGAVGQFLQTDGQGGTVWASVSSEGGASSSEVQALQTAVQQLQIGKADVSRVSTLETTVTGKANSTDVYTQTQINENFIQKPATSVQANKILSATGTNRGVQWVDPPAQLTIGTGANQAASGKALQDLSNTITGQNGLNSQIGSLDENKIDKPQIEGQPSDGTQGQILKTNGDGTTEWINSLVIGTTEGTAVDAKRFNTLNTKVDTFFANNEKFDSDLSKRFYGRKILFIGDSYCQGYSNNESERNYGWAKYCGDFLGITRTSSNLTAPLSMADVGPVKVKGTTALGQPDTTSGDRYEIICNGGARFAEGNPIGTNFLQLLIDAHDNKFPNYTFTDIICCGGYNDREKTQTQIETGIENFCTKVRTYYGENINIYIGQIGKNKSDSTIQNNIENNVTPAYRNCNNYGATYISNVEDILLDSEISEDGYHPNETGNTMIGKAVALFLLTTRRYLFISDARYVRNRGRKTNGWIDYCIQYMGLTHTNYNESSLYTNSLSSRIDKSPYDNCQIIIDDTQLGVARFYDGSGPYVTSNQTFEKLLESAHNIKFRGYYFTDIVVCGGMAQLTPSSVYANNNQTVVINAIKTGINNFMNQAKNYYPNANVYIGHIGYSTNTNVNNFIKSMSIPAYKACLDYGATYLNNVEYWPTKSGLFNLADTMEANPKGIQSIGRAVASALLSGSAPLPEITSSNYDQTLRDI